MAWRDGAIWHTPCFSLLSRQDINDASLHTSTSTVAQDDDLPTSPNLPFWLIFQPQNQGRMCISTITLGEMVFGAEHSQQVERNLTDIEAMVARLEVLPFNNNATYHFGRIRAELYSIGRPIGPYDMMIAGHARAEGLILVTNNVNEFKLVPGLILENWIN